TSHVSDFGPPSTFTPARLYDVAQQAEKRSCLDILAPPHRTDRWQMSNCGLALSSIDFVPHEIRLPE
nr:hypothetical protein [Tanacetum cinerariifolium]